MLSSGYQEKTEAVVQPRTARRKYHLQRWFLILMFLLPGLAIYSYFVIIPIFQSGYYSFFRWNGLGPLDNFVGFDNYAKIFNDKFFMGALGHNLWITVLSLLIQLPMALGLALLVARKMPGRGFFRLIFFLPFVLSDTTTGVMWTFVYQPQNGLLNSLLTTFNIGKPQGWLGNPDLALLAIFVVMCWKYFGFHLILFVAGLQEIPPDLEEAARIDGASNFNTLRYITLPLLGSTIRMSVFLSIIGSLQYFDLIWVMTKGGPISSTETLSTYMIKFGFERFALGYGNALAVIIFLLCLGFSLAYQRTVMRQDLGGERKTRKTKRNKTQAVEV